MAIKSINKKAKLKRANAPATSKQIIFIIKYTHKLFFN